MSQIPVKETDPPRFLSGAAPSPAALVALPESKGLDSVRTAVRCDSIAACDGVMDLLSVFFNVCGKELRSPKRSAGEVARVRQIGMYVAHVVLGLKMADVGEGFGRDKSTVVHACHTIEDMRDDADFDMIVSRAERLVAIAFALLRGEGGENE